MLVHSRSLRQLACGAPAEISHGKRWIAVCDLPGLWAGILDQSSYRSMQQVRGDDWKTMTLLIGFCRARQGRFYSFFSRRRS